MLVNNFSNEHAYFRKLDDTSLEKISSGAVTYAQAQSITHAGIITGIVSGVGALSFGVGSVVCSVLAKNVSNKNQTKATKLSQASRALEIAALSCTGLAIGGVSVAKIFHDKERILWINHRHEGKESEDPLNIEAQEDDERLGY